LYTANHNDVNHDGCKDKDKNLPLCINEKNMSIYTIFMYMSAILKFSKNKKFHVDFIKYLNDRNKEINKKTGAPFLITTTIIKKYLWQFIITNNLRDKVKTDHDID